MPTPYPPKSKEAQCAGVGTGESSRHRRLVMQPDGWKLGDKVYFRHPAAGELQSGSDHLHLVRGAGVDTVPGKGHPSPR